MFRFFEILVNFEAQDRFLRNRNTCFRFAWACLWKTAWSNHVLLLASTQRNSIQIKGYPTTYEHQTMKIDFTSCQRWFPLRPRHRRCWAGAGGDAVQNSQIILVRGLFVRGSTQPFWGPFGSPSSPQNAIASRSKIALTSIWVLVFANQLQEKMVSENIDISLKIDEN